ncbi:heme ABC transporter ATP-binding protein [Salmonella enterica]
MCIRDRNGSSSTHQPLPGAADTVRRLALTGGGAGL